MSEEHSHNEEHPFYGSWVLASREQKYIQQILKKYRNEPVNEDLKKKIWEELQMEKHYGRIKIPFKVVIQADSTGKFPPFVEVILDTKV